MTVTIEGEEELNRKIQAVQFFLHNDIMDIIGVESVNHFKQSFEDEGFTDSSLEKWKSRASKRLTRNEQKTMSDTGELADSIDYKVNGMELTVYSDKPYAQIHNEGGEITVTPKMRSFFIFKHYEAVEAGNDDVADMWLAMFFSDTITVPERQYIGESEMLNANIMDKIVRQLDIIFKS
ncbi:MAG TPA: phage virion morphogenesis protein [Chitinophagales bacterium]|nr:phage virion morphogenesis protein [Chitinophagales bacterium]